MPRNILWLNLFVARMAFIERSADRKPGPAHSGARYPAHVQNRDAFKLNSNTLSTRILLFPGLYKASPEFAEMAADPPLK